MYSKELEELIEAAIADGVISEQEQAVLFRRAQQEGVDPNELAVVVNGRLDKIRQQRTEAAEKKRADGRAGSVLKCPHCGAVVNRMMGKCPECGHVFTNVKAGATISRLSERMSSSKFSVQSMIGTLYGVDSSVTNLAIPNSKEELMDIMLFLKNQPKDKFKFYIDKLQECIERCRILFPNDPEVMGLVVVCEKQIKKEKRGKQILTIGAILFGLVFIVWGFFSPSQSENGKKEAIEEQLKTLLSQIDALPVPTEDNYKQATLDISKIVWLPVDGYEDDVEKAITTFVNKKNGYIHSINSLGMGETIPDDAVENYMRNKTIANESIQDEEVNDEQEAKEDVSNSGIVGKVDEQYEKLHEQLETLLEVDTENFETVVADLAGLLWTPITNEAETAKKTFKSPSDDEKYERKVKERWFSEVKALARKLKAFYKSNKESLGEFDTTDLEKLVDKGYVD